MLNVNEVEPVYKSGSAKAPIILYMMLIALSPLFTFKTAFMSSFIVATAEILIMLFLCDRFTIQFKVGSSNSELIPLWLFLLSVITSNLLLLINNDFISIEIALSITRTFLIFVHVLFSVVLVRYFFIKYDFGYVFKILPLTVVFYLIGLLLYYMIGGGKFLNNEYDGLPLVQNRRFLGYIVMIASTILSCHILMYRHQINQKLIITLITTVINLTFLFWLGGRGAIVSYFITVIGFTIIQKYKGESKINHKGIILLIISLLLSTILSEITSVYDWNGLFRFAFDTDEVTLNQYTSSRLSMWIASLDYIYDKPWFGHGSDAYLILGITPHYHPHNFIIQIMLEFGVVGFLLFSLFFISLLIKSFLFSINNKSTIVHDISLCIVVGLFTHGLIDGTIYHATPLMFLSIFTSYVYFERNVIGERNA
ncbi:O-antigen ligase family protein [Vibrio breoganii]|uniref:O-antigen ligase family protein n=1 Tax=Vibrio breoganii TaxID=553239 RepID=UPI00031C4702|nr:O-antigen ligase family protein [Vibrio breoganii]OED88480.1 hypothetical protein A1QE_07560 [Vibrio breoganii ZF-55]